MRVHELKTWPEPFQAAIDGRKTYEIRCDDRGFAVGDWLTLREFDPSPEPGFTMPRGYTGRSLARRITYMTPGGSWDLPPNICVLGLGGPETP